MTQNIDELIRRNLQQEDRALFDQLESDMNIQDMALSAFQGRSRGLKLFAALLSLVFFVLAIYCFWHFIQTTAVRPALNWALGGTICILNVAMLKMYFWMEMHKLALLRELKRVELQLSGLRDGRVGNNA